MEVAPDTNKGKNMKIKVLLLVVISITLFSSCYSTVNLYSQKQLEEKKASINANLENLGYSLTNVSSEDVFDISGQEANSGFTMEFSSCGKSLKSNEYTKDLYTFRNNNGETAQYIVQYKQLPGYVFDIKVDGCSTSNGTDYGKICMGSNSPKLIESMSVDKTEDYCNKEQTQLAKTTSIVVLILAGIALVPFLIL